MVNCKAFLVLVGTVGGLQHPTHRPRTPRYPLRVKPSPFGGRNPRGSADINGGGKHKFAWWHGAVAKCARAHMCAFVAAWGILLAPPCDAAPPTPLFSSWSITHPPRSVLDDVLRTVEQNYVGSFDRSRLEIAAARSIVEGLRDPFSSLVVKHPLPSAGGGTVVGLSVVKDSRVSDALIVVNVEDNSPARRAGIRVGDRITAVDHTPVRTSYPLDTTLLPFFPSTQASTSDEATAVHTTVLRPGVSMPLELAVALPRDDLARPRAQSGAGSSITLALTLPVTPAPARAPPTSLASTPPAPSSGECVMYVKLDVFGPSVGAEFSQAMSEVDMETCRGVVIDVRNNPGGLLKSAVELSSALLSEQPGAPIAQFQPRQNAARVTFQAEEATVDSPNVLPAAVPMVVLVDGNTKSAAELFASALQSNHRATVMGTRTYGKSTAQQDLQLEAFPSKKLSVRLSTARFWTPEGVSLTESGGIVPDIQMSPEDLPLPPLGASYSVKALVRAGAFFDFADAWLQSSNVHPLSGSDLVGGAEEDGSSGDQRLAFEFASFVEARAGDYFGHSPVGEDIGKLRTDAAAAGTFGDWRTNQDFDSDARLQQAMEALEREYRAAMVRDLQANEEEVVQRIREALDVRVLTQREMRLKEFRNDRVIKRAFDLLLLQTQPEQSHVYPSSEAVTLVSPSDETRTAQGRFSASPVVPGYEDFGECLPLQVCNTEEFVYVRSL